MNPANDPSLVAIFKGRPGQGGVLYRNHEALQAGPLYRGSTRRGGVWLEELTYGFPP